MGASEMSDMMREARGPFFALAFVALLVGCLTFARDYAVPVAVAVLIWFLINALADAIRRTPEIGAHVPFWLARLVAMGVMAGIVTLGVQVIVDNIGALSTGVRSDVEANSAVLLARLEDLLGAIGIEATMTPRELAEALELERLLRWALQTAQGLISDAALVFLYVAFLIVDERFYDAKMRALIADESRRERLRAALRRIAAETRAYLWLMSLISAGVALVTWGVCAAVGLEGAAFWGFVAFALNFVPTIGSITAVVLPALYGLVTLDDPVALVALIGLLAATQFVAGEVVLPRVMGDRLNLSSVVILLMLVVWGAMWGAVGMFLAIPITVILTLVCARFETTRPIAVVLSKTGEVPKV